MSFVSGIILETASAKAIATDRWDGTEFYQMYVGTRMIAAGADLLTLDAVAVRKDIQIPGEAVDSYRKPKLKPCPIIERPINVVTIGALVADAIDPHVGEKEKQKVVTSIFVQLLVFTYPFWIFEYRRVQSWKYAVGVCLAMRPGRILHGQHLNLARRFAIAMLYSAVTAAGLLIPVGYFQRLTPAFHRMAKSVRHAPAVGG
jgi:hypothetical protein